MDGALAEMRDALVDTAAVPEAEDAADGREAEADDVPLAASLTQFPSLESLGEPEEDFFRAGDEGQVVLARSEPEALLEAAVGPATTLLPDDDASVRTLSQMVRVEQQSYRRRNALIVGGILLILAAVVLTPILLSGGEDEVPMRRRVDPSRSSSVPARPEPVDVPSVERAAAVAVPLGEEPGGTMQTDEMVELAVVDLSEEDEGGAEAGEETAPKPRRTGRNGRKRPDARERGAHAEAGSSGPGTAPTIPGLAADEEGKGEVPIALPDVAVRSGAAQALTETRLSNLLRRKARRFVRCKDRDDTVKVTITLTVATDGRVRNVHITDDVHGGAPSLRSCVQRVIEAWIFPPQDAAQRLTRVMIL